MNLKFSQDTIDRAIAHVDKMLPEGHTGAFVVMPTDGGGLLATVEVRKDVGPVTLDLAGAVEWDPNVNGHPDLSEGARLVVSWR